MGAIHSLFDAVAAARGARSAACVALGVGVLACGAWSQTQPVSFAPAVHLSLHPFSPPLPESAMIADVSGDGVPDVIVGDGDTRRVSVLRGLGGGALAPAVAYNAKVDAMVVAVGDVNEDGHQDLVVSGNGLSVLLGQGGGVFGVATIILPFTVGPTSAALADLDADGHLDVALAIYVPSSVSVLRGDGTGALGALEPHAAGLGPSFVAIGDLDLDGVPDLSVTNANSDDVSVLLGLGGGSFAAAATYAVGTQPRWVALGDLDGDGWLDLAVANRVSNDVSVLLSQGNGTFGVATQHAVGVQPRSVAVGDLNGDGRLDLAASNAGSDTVSVRRGLGNGSFHPALNFAVQDMPRGLGLGDLDADGKLEIVVANFFSSSVSILANTSPWLKLGFALAGVSGAPDLAGAGTLAAGSSGMLSLTAAAPGALALLFASLSSAPAPFKCGTLVPLPMVLTLPLATDGAGNLPLGWASWPAGLSGLELHFQYAIQDGSAPCGASLSNALRADVP